MKSVLNINLKGLISIKTIYLNLNTFLPTLFQNYANMKGKFDQVRFKYLNSCETLHYTSGFLQSVEMSKHCINEHMCCYRFTAIGHTQSDGLQFICKDRELSYFPQVLKSNPIYTDRLNSIRYVYICFLHSILKTIRQT